MLAARLPAAAAVAVLLLAPLPAFGEERGGFPVEGFGAATVGGWQPGHRVLRVTDLGDAGRGTLRAALRPRDRPVVVVFDVEGDIALERPIDVPSNVSVDGRGRRVRLLGKGLSLRGVEQVVVTHLTIENVVPGPDGTLYDAIGIADRDGVPSRHVVVDHVTLRQVGVGAGRADRADEALSVINGSNAITVAWSRIEGWEKVMLLGRGPGRGHTGDENITVTLHHNLFRGNARRHPRAHFGIFDLYNNALLDWRAFYGLGEMLAEGAAAWNRTYGVLCHDGCRAVLEANVFSKAELAATDAFSWAREASRCAPALFNAFSHTAGSINHLANWTPAESIALEFGVGCETHAWRRPYPATIDRADGRLLERLVFGAGDPATR